jgi:hypothetical protein
MLDGSGPCSAIDWFRTIIGYAFQAMGFVSSAVVQVVITSVVIGALKRAGVLRLVA